MIRVPGMCLLWVVVRWHCATTPSQDELNAPQEQSDATKEASVAPHAKARLEASTNAATVHEIALEKDMWAKGRVAAKAGMSSNTLSWYYHKDARKTHDAICTNALGQSFATLAGE